MSTKPPRKKLLTCEEVADQFNAEMAGTNFITITPGLVRALVSAGFAQVNEWDITAKAIRERRFDDISAETWELVADKIENKKRGKGRPVKTNDGPDKVFAGGRTENERSIYILEKYDELREQGVKSSEAQAKIVKDSGYTTKTVEAVLTPHRKHRNIIETLKNGNFDIAYYDEKIRGTIYEILLSCHNPNKYRLYRYTKIGEQPPKRFS